LATRLVKTHCDKTDMALGLYQIGNKYRDEPRVRADLSRAKEFPMKDAYSFHSDEDAAKEAYASARPAYLRFFKRLGLDVVVRASDNGEIGLAKSIARAPWPFAARCATAASTSFWTIATSKPARNWRMPSSSAAVGASA
jgi:prolyl-tRNA synthetase